MSTNDPARPQSSRRGFLTAGAAALAGSGTGIMPAAAAQPDPVFALIEAERVAWDRLSAALTIPLREVDLDPRPRVQIGSSVHYFERGGCLPEEERTEKPLFAYSVEEIEQAFGSPPTAPMTIEVDGKRHRFETTRAAREDALAQFTEEVAKAEAVRGRSGIDDAEQEQDAASDAHEAAVSAVYLATPTTRAGLLAMIEMFEKQDLECIDSPVNGYVSGIFDAVRSLLGEA